MPLLYWLLAAAVLYLLAGLRVVKEYERGVVLRLGRYAGTRAPGLTVVPPLVDTMARVSLRTVTLDILPPALPSLFASQVLRRSRISGPRRAGAPGNSP